MQGPYKGTVTANLDPSRACRVRAHIPDLYYDADTDEIVESPWIEAMTGAAPGMGIVNVPPVGASIFVWTEPQEDDQGVWGLCYTAGATIADYNTEAVGAPRISLGMNDLSTVLKGETKASVPSSESVLKDLDDDKLSEAASIIYNDVLAPESMAAPEYPYNRCMQTPNGIQIELDDTPNANRIHVYHPSGTYIELGHDGQWCDRSSVRYTECESTRTEITGADLVEFVGANRRSRVAGKSVQVVDGLQMNKARRIAMDADVQISLNSKGPFLALSDGIGKYDHAMGMKVAVGGTAEYSFSSNKTESVTGDSSLALGGTLKIFTPSGMKVDGPLLNPLDPLFLIKINELQPQVQQSRVSATGGVHLELDALPNGAGEVFIVRSGGAVSFAGGLVSSPLPATSLAKWNIGNAPNTGLQLFLTNLMVYLATLEAKIAALSGGLSKAAAAAAAVAASPEVIVNPAATAATTAATASATAASTAVAGGGAELAAVEAVLATLNTGGFTTALRSQ